VKSLTARIVPFPRPFRPAERDPQGPPDLPENYRQQPLSWRIQNVVMTALAIAGTTALWGSATYHLVKVVAGVF